MGRHRRHARTPDRGARRGAPEEIRKRQLDEEAKYGEIWRKLIKDVIADDEVRSDLDRYMAQMFVLVSLKWAVEWWNPKRGSLKQVVQNAQSFVRNGLQA